MATIPGLPSGAAGVTVNTRHSRLYNNQFFDYLTEQMPQNHKEMFQWCEMVWSNSPVIVNAIKKLINYPLTDFTYKTDSDKVRKATKELIEDHLKLKSHLLDLGLDYYIYGNAFRSIYFPFTRFLECSNPRCKNEVNVQEAKYRMRKGAFILKCPECGLERSAKINDKYSDDPSKIKLISWDPKQFELFSNPITADVAYYYQMPSRLRSGIHSGNPVLVNTLPEVFLDAFKAGKSIQLSKNFYHFKAGSLSGMSSGWGISPLVPTLKLYMYTAILRKANEAIGLEHITPKRILFPQGTSNDPSMMSGLGRWREQVERALKMWRQDPNYVMIAPHPTGVADIGGRGRQLMAQQEVRAAEEDMIRALDIPVEFVFGNSNLTNSPVLLRMLENQLTPYMDQVKAYVNWIIDTVNARYDKNYCHVDFTSFTLSDDVMQKQLLVQMAGQGVSMSTVQEALNLDPHEENERIKKDSIDGMRRQQELEQEQVDMQNDIALQAQQDQQAQQGGTIPQYNQQKLMAKAQNLVAQLIAVPYEQRRSYLAQLKGEDFVMYAMVAQLLESAHKNKDDHPNAPAGNMSPGAGPMS